MAVLSPVRRKGPASRSPLAGLNPWLVHLLAMRMKRGHGVNRLSFLFGDALRLGTVASTR